MKHLVIVSHSILSNAFIETAKMICGENLLKNVKSFGLTEEESADGFMEKLKEYVDEDPEGEYFVMADLYAASPCTSSVRVLGKYNYRLVTGINLGMLLEILTSFESCSLEELEEKAINAGKEGVNKFYLHV